MADYVGILEGDAEGWSIRVPDLPGCHGAGDTPGEAIADTISAMIDWSQTLLRDGVPIPVPRGIHEVTADQATEFDPACEVAVLLPLLIDRGRPAKANISLDAGMLEAIDTEAQRRGMTRSAFLVSAAQDKILSRR